MPEKTHALLVHGYCDDWPDIPQRPDKFSQMQVQAAAELVRAERVSVVVFALQATTAEGNAVADLMLDEFNQVQQDQGLTKVMAIVPPSSKATTTRGEIREFQKLQYDGTFNGLPLAALAIEPHANRVRRAVRRLATVPISVWTAESVLNQTNPAMIADVQADPLYEGMRRREKILNTVDFVPLLGGPLLEQADKLMRSKKFEARSVTLLGKL